MAPKRGTTDEPESLGLRMRKASTKKVGAAGKHRARKAVMKRKTRKGRSRSRGRKSKKGKSRSRR